MSEIRIKVIIRKIAQQFEFTIPLSSPANFIVKVALQRLNNPPQKMGKLFFNGSLPDQARTLQQLGIKQDSTVEIEFSYRTTVNVQHNYYDVYRNVDVDLWDSPQTLKDRILKKHSIDKYGYSVNLLFNNNLLEGNKALFEYGIQDQSNIQYTVTATLIIINPSNQNKFDIQFEVTKTIEELQNLIKTKLNIVGSFELECEGEKLNEFQTNFFSLRIQNRSEIYIRINKLWKIKIRKEGDMEPIEKIFTVNPDAQVISLEQCAKESFYIEPSVKLNLMFQDQKLDSQKKISECNLHSGCLLILVQDRGCPSKIEIILIEKGDPQIQQIVKIDINTYVNVLDIYYPSEQVKYFFNDQVLDKSKSFKDQLIEDRSQIYYEIVAAFDLKLVFINTATDEKYTLDIKSNEKISERIQKLLHYDKKMPASFYCVVHKGKSVDNPDQPFGELPEIENDQIITYCSQKLQIQIIFNAKTRQLEVERELTIIELGYNVKKELNIENDIDILQNGQKIPLNQKIKTKGRIFEIIEKPAQQQVQNVQQAQQQAQNNMQALFEGHGNQLFQQFQFPQQQQPPVPQAVPQPVQPRQEKEISIILYPADMTIEMKVDVTMSIGEILNELRVQQEFPPNQPLYCEIGGVGVDDNVLLNTFQDLSYIQVEILNTLTVFFKNKVSNTQNDVLVSFDDPLEVKAKLLGIDHHKFTWKNQVIDIKKSCQTLGIANLDVIYYESQSQIQQQIKPSIQIVKVIIDFEDQQPQKINITPQKTIGQLKKENDLIDVLKHLFIKSTKQKAQDYQKIGDLATNGELFLVYKQEEKEPNPAIPIKVKSVKEQIVQEEKLDDSYYNIYEPSDEQLKVSIENKKQNMVVSQKNEQPQQKSEVQPKQPEKIEEKNQNIEPNAKPVKQPEQSPIVPQNINFDQHPLINITLVLSRERILLENIDQNSTVEGLKQLILKNHKNKIVFDLRQAENTSDFQLCFENKYLRLHDYLYNLGLANKELKIYRIINIKVNGNSEKKIQWGKKVLLSFTWMDLKKKLLDEIKVPLEKVQLKYKNQCFEDQITFYECNMMDNDEVELVIL